MFIVFDMALSVGDISDNGIGEQRKNVLKKMLSVWFVEDLDYQVEEKYRKLKLHCLRLLNDM